MDGVANVRGRGSKTNVTLQRLPSRNKQWLASSQENNHANGGDAHRWERGGGPRRGAVRGHGRGRNMHLGSGRSTPHLTAPSIHDEAASATEDEVMTDVEEPEGDFENEAMDPEQPEKRETFYQEVRSHSVIQAGLAYGLSAGQSPRA